MKVRTEVDIVSIKFLVVSGMLIILITILLGIISNLPDAYSELISKAQSIPHIQIIAILSIVITSSYVYTKRNKKNSQQINDKEKIINQYLGLMQYIRDNQEMSDLAPIFEQRVQILNKQLNCENHRDKDVDAEFFKINKETNRQFIKKNF